MKEMWERPRIAVQVFVPGEYAASVCYGLPCSVYETGNSARGNKNNKDSAAFNIEFNGTQYSKNDLWGDWLNGSLKGTRTEKDKNNDGYYNDHSGSCMSETNNYVSVADDNTIDIFEMSSDQGHLPGVITKSVDKTGDGYGAGDLFAWVTYNDINYWLHWAIATVLDENHANHS